MMSYMVSSICFNVSSICFTKIREQLKFIFNNFLHKEFFMCKLPIFKMVSVRKILLKSTGALDVGV